VTGRIVRALVWLQWRTVVNRLTRSSHRDGLEQASRWSEVVLRVIVTALAIPLVVGLAIAAIAGGYAAARSRDDAAVVALAAGFTLIVPLLWMLLRPLMMLGSGGIERGILLRLLPIPTGLLRNAEVVRAMADPAFLVFAPAVLLLPLGAAAAGRPMLARAAMLAGVAFLAIIALLGNVLTLAAQLLLRGRRRAELVTLLFLVALSTMGVLPQLFVHPSAHDGDAGGAKTAAEAPDAPPTERILAFVRPLPPAAYAATILDGGANRWGLAALDVALLLAGAGLLYAATIPIHRRLMTVPEGGRGRKVDAAVRERHLHLPFASSPTVAVAAAELRALTRTVRGKMVVLYPALMTGMMAAVFSRKVEGAPPLQMGATALGAFGVFGTIAGIGALACNQFAIQGGALVLELLLPLRERTLAAGKAVAIGALVAAGLVLALLPPAVIFPETSPAVWIAMWLAGVAAYAGAAPAAAVLSALFVKPVELSRIGRGGQPNALATLLYLIAVAAAAAPAAALIFVALKVLAAPWIAPPLVLVYAIAAVLLARAVLPIVERVVAARRENLALVVAGR
jgi:hypothetical protein